MKPKQRKQLEQVFDVSFKIDIEEILDKKILSFDSRSHIILPAKYGGKKAKIIIYY